MLPRKENRPNARTDAPGAAIPARRFRCRGNKFIITYPKCNLTKLVVMEFFQDFFQDYEFIIVCNELHKDKTNHLHVVVSLPERKALTNCRVFDIRGYHPSIEAARSLKAVAGYVIKDADYLLEGISREALSALVSKGGGICSIVASAILEKPSNFHHIIAANPEILMQYSSGVRALYEFAIDYEIRKSIVPLPFPNPLPPLPTRIPYVPRLTGPFESSLAILEWLGTNLFHPRPFKTPQLYLWSANVNWGKTTLLRTLDKLYRRYTMPTGPYIDRFNDHSYDLITFDEYCKVNCKPVTWLNQFLQGDRMLINRKGDHILKCKNLPVIIVSNFSPMEIYSKLSPVALSTLYARLEVIELDEPLFKLCKYIESLFHLPA